MCKRAILIFNLAVHEFRFCQTCLTVATKPLEVFNNNCFVRKKPRTRHAARALNWHSRAIFRTTLTRANKLVHACFARENVETASSAPMSTPWCSLNQNGNIDIDKE